MSDDWKGESLIRSVRRAHPGKSGWEGERPVKKDRTARTFPMCQVPGCERKLYASNMAGVCRKHNHTPGYCKCPNCTARNK